MAAGRAARQGGTEDGPDASAHGGARRRPRPRGALRGRPRARGLADAADPLGGGLRRRGRRRHRGPRRGRQARRDPRPVRGDREPHRRQRGDRRQRRAAIAARRLHLPHRRGEPAHQPGADARAALRLPRRLRPRLAGRRLSAGARGQARIPGADDRGVHRPRQGQARHGQLRHAARRRHGPPRGRAVPAPGGHPLGARALPRRRRRGAGHRRWRGGRGGDHHLLHPPARAGRPGARAGGHQRAARRRLSRRSEPGRARLPGLRHERLERPFRRRRRAARGHPPPRRRGRRGVPRRRA